MEYRILSAGEVINTIVSDEDFVKEYCAENGYTYEQAEADKPQTEPEPTETERLRADVDFLAAMAGVEL